ncbi:RNA polymerase sigma factor [Paraflavisolibacter sp. H34]|uniref:RNA polymerase sigma factor n=1 Tax=Huijunlia imazamoxiresistens TaxID=3127457 RepID=UPI0030184CB8
MDKEWILQVAEGNEAAFRQLFDHYWDHIYSVAFALTKSSPLAEEIVQDVFLKIWIRREQLPAIDKFDGYLFMVARNHIYNELRKKTAEQPFVDHLEQYFLETSALPEQQLLLKETKQLILKAVAQLPAQQRAVYELSRNEGLDHARIAEKLGISKLTVKSHMTKALQAIRQYLEKHTDGLLFLLCMLGTLYP